MSAELVQLRNGGVSVVLEAQPHGSCRILHWGADLGSSADLPALVRAIAPPLRMVGPDVEVSPALVPERCAGYLGRPGLTGSRQGRDWSPRFSLTAVEHERDERITLRSADRDARLSLRSELRLEPSGVLRLRHALRNDSVEPYVMQELSCVVPIPAVAGDVLDLTGRWCRERHPQRRPLGMGTWLRETRHGRTGHDATLLLVAGTPGFDFRTGEVWGVHLAWSGDASSFAERLVSGPAVLGAAELLGPGEVALGAGEEYVTPWLYAVWSDDGLDGLSARLHRWQRARPNHPRTRGPVVLNTWEAVHVDHGLARLTALAERAAAIGVERFVLDDGWFRGRRDDATGLGDWQPDPEVWPEGLAPLIRHVTELGMQFGLWVEPEMVNPDSELFRAHPDWILSAGRRPPPTARHQQVLDLARRDVQEHLLGQLDALLRGNDIAYLKWDHNRDLVDPGHDGRPSVRAQTLAAYALIDRLRDRHPGIEIESCASGGGRIDLAILERTDRVWPSDSNDALERQAIQRWTQLLVAPELIGTHIGPPRARTSGRRHALSFRVATALFGHLGVEWDITTASPEEQDGLRESIAYYKGIRALLQCGTVVRVEHPDPAALVHGVVGPDRRRALFSYVQLSSSVTEIPPLVRLAGLDAAVRYHVRPVPLAGGPETLQRASPPWYADGGVSASGAALMAVGLQVPVLRPENALLLELES